MTCRGATSHCIATPAKPYRRWPGNEPVTLCDPCAAELRSMGLGLELVDERPEWRRRLTAKDMTGAMR